MGQFAQCPSQVIISYASQLVRTSESVSGISKIGMWLNAGAVAGGVSQVRHLDVMLFLTHSLGPILLLVPCNGCGILILREKDINHTISPSARVFSQQWDLILSTVDYRQIFVQRNTSLQSHGRVVRMPMYKTALESHQLVNAALGDAVRSFVGLKVYNQSMSDQSKVAYVLQLHCSSMHD